MDTIATLRDLPTIAKALHDAFKEGGIVLLRGDLASGKTTLVQAYARHLGLDTPITSPTFSLMQSYGEMLHHYDLYQRPLASLLDLGLLEMLERPGVHFVEWGDEELATLLVRIGLPPMVLEIHPTSHARRYILTHA